MPANLSLLLFSQFLQENVMIVLISHCDHFFWIISNSWFQTFAMFWMLYAFFWVIPRRMNFICRRFGTLSLFHLHRQVGVGMIRFEICWCIHTGKGLAQAIFEPNLFPYNTPTFLNLIHSTHTYLPMKMERFPKRRHIKFRRQGITQKKAYISNSTHQSSYHSTLCSPRNWQHHSTNKQKKTAGKRRKPQ